jgi:hypothetical protein
MHGLMRNQNPNFAAEDMNAERHSYIDATPVKEHDIVRNEDLECQVLSATASKKIGHLSKIDVAIYPIDIEATPYQVDENNTFLDDRLYIEIGVRIKNTSGNSVPVLLTFLKMCSCPEDSSLFDSKEAIDDLWEIDLTSITENVHKKGNDEFTLSSGEERVCYVGYILTEEEYLRVKDSLYLMPDCFGEIVYSPEKIYRIKLSIIDEF